MIKKEELIKIGKFNKPHGVQGELLFTFTDDIFDRSDCDYLVCSVDGIFVPFFIDEYRFKSDTSALMLLDGVNTIEKARMFTNTDVYFPLKYMDDDEKDDLPGLSSLIGFTVIDKRHGLLGSIKAVDDSTANAFAEVESDKGVQHLIPLNEEMIAEFDKKKRTITFDLPEGLLTMNNGEQE
jgi:16S rRNA processing protein RimM